MEPLRPLSTARASGFPIEVPFIEHLGLKMLEHGQAHAIVELTVQPWMTNSWQVLHGGIVMTMLDVAMAMAGRPLDAKTDGITNSVEPLTEPLAAPVGNVTIEMKTSFIRPANGTLRAKGICLRRATSLSFCEAELFDEQKNLIAKSSGTFKFWRGQ
jgi:acyl-coenzyme A thioesterase PaaI-like protein